MPPRSEGELDPVTLHNVALMRMDDNPNEHLPKLNFLLTIPNSPPTVFSNLLLLYTKYGLYDVAADVMAENAQLSLSNLDPVLRFLTM
jgi:tetratricopeptide repeat protein 30